MPRDLTPTQIEAFFLSDVFLEFFDRLKIYKDNMRNHLETDPVDTLQHYQGQVQGINWVLRLPEAMIKEYKQRAYARAKEKMEE